MDAVSKRLDHLGIVAGTLEDLGIIELINEQIGIDSREDVTTGECVAAMIMNGLAFTGKSLSLTPNFFKNKAMDVLFNRDISPEQFNSAKLGRALDKLYEYGLEKLFLLTSSVACNKEKVDISFKSLDTTTISLTGEYDSDNDSYAVKVTHGYSKDHRPDLKQVIHELIVSQDGGIPLMMKSWDGNISDNQIFKERTKRLLNELKESDFSDCLVADSKLYSKENAGHLKYIDFITRIPNTINFAQEAVCEAIQQTTWQSLNDTDKYCVKKVLHHGIEQRWIIVFSKSANNRAAKAIEKLIKKEKREISAFEKDFLKATYDCEGDAVKDFYKFQKSIKFHHIFSPVVKQKAFYTSKGRPSKDAQPDGYHYYITFAYELNEPFKNEEIARRSCYVIGSNVSEDKLSDKEVVEKYKNQNTTIENMGFRFLKDPIFFASSLFVKKESRIEGLLFIMTLSLLVYSIAQRKLRQALKENNDTVPYHCNREIQKPTLRWVFQLFEGISVIFVKIKNETHRILDGLNDRCRRIIEYLGGNTALKYAVTNG